MFKAREHECKRCSINEFNGLLEALANRPIWLNEDPNGKDVGPRVYVYTIISKAYLVFNVYAKKVTTQFLETDLNEQYEDGYFHYMKSVNQHCSAISRAVKLPKLINNKEEAVVNATGILWSNRANNKKLNYSYEYDMHLAWLTTFMTCPLPDTSKPMRTNDIVKEGEIGFLKNGLYKWNCGDSVVFSGNYAQYIFPIMKCPNLAYFERLVKTIDNEKNRLKRKDLKARFNEWLGSQQNHNPFIRVAVIAQSNMKIIDLIERYRNKVVFSVTDSLGATERIPELDNSKDWAIKSEGYLYMDGLNRLYLDDKGIIKNSIIRGVPKQHVKNLHIQEYKKLTKKIDISKNIYKLDFENKEIILNG